MEFTPYVMLMDFCLMSGLMFFAQILRGKVKILQDTYLPSSVIAGALGLLLGPQFLNVLPFSGSCDQYPYLLVCILFAGLFIGKNEKMNFRFIVNRVGDTFCINMASEILGFATALFFGGIVLKLFFSDSVFSEIALLQPAGFTGGHGYAAAIGGTLNHLLGRNDCVYIGQTFATIGLLVGIFGGLFAINVATRKKATSFISTVDKLSESARTGKLSKKEQEIMGKETIHRMTMDPLAFHVVLVLIATGIGYEVYEFYKVVPALANIEVPMMCLTMLAGVVLQLVVKKIGYADQVDKRIIDRIGSSVTDYLVGFGIATIKVSVVLEFWQAIVILSIIGTLFAFFVVFFIGRKLFHNYWFERSIFIFGYITGVVAIGVTLLRIVDPDMKSGALDDFGTAYTLQSVIELFLVMLSPIFVVKNGSILTGAVMMTIGVGLLLLCRTKYGSSHGTRHQQCEGEKKC